MRGIRRTLGAAKKEAPPILPEQLRAMMAALPSTPRGIRDRAMIVLGFAGAFRRSEIVALNVEDLTFTDDGLVVTVHRSKTDQEGAGSKVGIPYGSNRRTCPVRSVRAWIETADIAEGPLFRGITRGGITDRRASDQAVDRAVKRAAKAAKIEGDFSAHSLRAGLATSAARAGKGDRAIMRQGRWRSRGMVDRYVREVSLFENNAAAGIGL
jgi:integrase